MSGLQVFVAVRNRTTGLLILTDQAAPEVPAGSGQYTYNWTHGLTEDTDCVVTYTVNGSLFKEYISIGGGGFTPGRAY